MKNGPDATCARLVVEIISSLCLLWVGSEFRRILGILVGLGLRLQSLLLIGNGNVMRDSEQMLVGKCRFALCCDLTDVLVDP